MLSPSARITVRWTEAARGARLAIPNMTVSNATIADSYLAIPGTIPFEPISEGGLEWSEAALPGWARTAIDVGEIGRASCRERVSSVV